MYRRTLLGFGVGSLVALLAWPLRAIQAASGTGYAKLREVVSIPSEEVAPWQPVSFNAFLKDPKEGEVDKMLKGMLLRTDQALQAFCIYCPHEVCMVEFRRDTASLKLDKPLPGSHPHFVCPCHFSAFDPLQSGTNVSGPAWRGLYRFQVEEDERNIHITAVEKSVLALYN